MSYIQVSSENHVAVLTIDRPKALNALNSEVLGELEAAIDALDLSDVRALIITGSGEKSFVAGADIGEMSTLTKAEGEAFGKKGNDVFRKIETLPIPVIAAVNGFALGGGNELAMSCDIRICSDNAVFGQPETGLGITPGFGGTQRLARLVSPGMARRWVPPKPGVMPRPVSGWPNTALSEQMRISQLMASSLPPPSAKPFTAAMTGMGRVSILRNTSLPFLPKASPSALVRVLISPMSAPATKLFSPEPVMMRARTSLRSRASMAASSSPSTSLFRAFRALGRSMVRTAT